MYIHCIPYTKFYANNMHVTCVTQVKHVHLPWCMVRAGSIYIYMLVALMFHVTCMDLGHFHACYMHDKRVQQFRICFCSSITCIRIL
jgi:hypothetical protein